MERSYPDERVGLGRRDRAGARLLVRLVSNRSDDKFSVARDRNCVPTAQARVLLERGYG